MPLPCLCEGRRRSGEENRPERLTTWRRKSEGGSGGGDTLRILQAERKGGRRAYTLLSARSACPEVERSAQELPAADGTPGAAMLIWRVVRRLWPSWQYATAHHRRRMMPGRTLYLHLCLRHPGLSSRTSGAGKNVWHLHLCLRYGAGRSGGAELLAIQALAVHLHLILGFRKKGLGSQLETASPVTVPGRGTKHPRQTAKPAVQLTRIRRPACDYATRT